MFELAPFPTGKRVAGLPNASTATGSGASIENEERDFSLEEILIPLELVHRVGRTGHAWQTAWRGCHA